MEGETDGCFEGQRYFSCPPGTGLFVGADRLRAGGPSVRRLKDKFERMHDSPPSPPPPPLKRPTQLISQESKERYEGSCLKAGDRVVWLSEDGGPIKGVVKWVSLSDDGQRVNVEFDEPLNGGEVRCVLPAVELVKAVDFFGCIQDANNIIENNTRNGTESKDIYSLGKESHDLISLHTPPLNNCDGRLRQKSREDEDDLYSEGEIEEEDGRLLNPGGFTVGSVVEVPVKGEPQYGVIRWIGRVAGDNNAFRTVAGIEMEEEHVGLSDGVFNGRRYFQCNPQKALFVSLSKCRYDSRFQDTHPPPHTRPEDFGNIDSPIISGIVRPISREGDIRSLCGKFRGIQGHHNSCYLDATLFSMFTFTSVFDSLLYRPGTPIDIPQYEEVQRVLREEIVNPLRENLYVRADRVMKLRRLMEKLSSVTGLTTEEKDPEEFLTSLVAQILKAEPFLKLSSGQEAYHYQLFVEKDEALTLPTVQQLFEQSFLASDIKLKQVPSCLIIQMPRFGKSFKMYPRILPSQLLDVTDVIEDSPRQCTVCGKLAEYECKQCFDQCDVGLQSISFCPRCLETAHSHERRRNHRWRSLSVPPEFAVLKDHCVIPRLYMQLFAVVCIETSHYVTFVKCGTGSDAPWCFFDSMADRKGEQNGYNIPEMVACPNLPYWLSEKGAAALEEVRDERQLPEHAKRLLCDAYMCMYQSSEVMMYR